MHSEDESNEVPSMESKCKKKRSLRRLGHKWSQVLINVRLQYRGHFAEQHNSNTLVWNKIHEELRELGLPEDVDMNTIRKRWANMMLKYKEVKSAGENRPITWRHYEQLHRAYLRDPSTMELRVWGHAHKVHNESLMTHSEFKHALIEKRIAYDYMFSKNSLNEGWGRIKEELPGANEYTIKRLNKLWSNLKQNYRKQLREHSDTSKITWMYFPKMHQIMTAWKQKEKTACNDKVFMKPFVGFTSIDKFGSADSNKAEGKNQRVQRNPLSEIQ